MKRIILLALFQFCIAMGYSQVRVVNFEELEKEFKKSNDSIKVINFWATWCGPCVEEMPYFVQAQENFKSDKVQFVYVSLDFSKHKDKVEQFIQTKGLSGKFFILKDDPNEYIGKVDKAWEGQIPITLIINKNKEYSSHIAAFHTYDELKEFIKTNF